MKTTLGLAIACLLISVSAVAQESTFQDELLDHFTGEWVLQGMIAGGERTHDIDAEWILGHQYLRFHEISREMTADGVPEYEASVHIGWVESLDQYACMWLDSTGGGGLIGEGIGHAERNGDELAFKFNMGEETVFHTTFTYIRESDSWEWRMDAETNGEFRPFARNTMTRR